jgi:hypothetical protein
MEGSVVEFLSIVARALDRNGIDPDNIDVTSKDPLYAAKARKYCKIDRVPPCPIEWATIKYRPSMAGNVIYLLCFVALLAAQIFYGTRKKTWTYLGALSVGLLLEIIGYIGRLMLNMNPFIMNNFLTYVLQSGFKAR